MLPPIYPSLRVCPPIHALDIVRIQKALPMSEPKDKDTDLSTPPDNPPASPISSTKPTPSFISETFVPRLYDRDALPSEEQREKMRQNWKKFEAESAQPDEIHRREVLKVTQSFSYEDVQTKVQAKLIKLGFLQDRVQMVLEVIDRDGDSTSFDEADIFEEALEILETNV